MYVVPARSVQVCVHRVSSVHVKTNSFSRAFTQTCLLASSSVYSYGWFYLMVCAEYFIMKAFHHWFQMSPTGHCQSILPAIEHVKRGPQSGFYLQSLTGF